MLTGYKSQYAALTAPSVYLACIIHYFGVLSWRLGATSYSVRWFHTCLLYGWLLPLQYITYYIYLCISNNSSSTDVDGISITAVGLYLLVLHLYTVSWVLLLANKINWINIIIIFLTSTNEKKIAVFWDSMYNVIRWSIQWIKITRIYTTIKTTRVSVTEVGALYTVGWAWS